MWLAVILACTNPAATSCDTLVRTGGLFQTKIQCERDLKEVTKYTIKNHYYVKTYCFKMTYLDNSA